MKPAAMPSLLIPLVKPAVHRHLTLCEHIGDMENAEAEELVGMHGEDPHILTRMLVKHH